jgi:hypothetical protein
MYQFSPNFCIAVSLYRESVSRSRCRIAFAKLECVFLFDLDGYSIANIDIVNDIKKKLFRNEKILNVCHVNIYKRVY